MEPHATEPHPSLSPTEVVRIQLTALQQNDEPTPDAGIRTVFKFASPANRAVTGPIERFITMVKTPLYRPMLSCHTLRFDPPKEEGEQAEQRVMIVSRGGEAIFYKFVLSRQRGAPHAGCWMTDAVLREGSLILN